MSADKENTDVENSSDLAETIADIETPAAAEEEPTKRAWKLPTAILFIALLTAGYVYSPQQMKSELADIVRSLIEPEKESVIIEPETTALPVVEPEPRTTDMETSIDVTEPVATESSAASSDEVKQMLSAIESLQSELESLRQDQQTIQETQLSLQKMQLRTRLRWITNAANHLPQLQLAWEEIILMPSLTTAEHATAQKMLTLAQQRLLDLRNWQQALQAHADSLTLPEYENIIPEYESPWLSWIRDYFSLKTASTTEQQRDEELRQQLLNTSRNIEMEQWPDAKSWQQLRARLQLKLGKADSDSLEAVDLGLPESFEPLKADIAELRQAAATWLEELS